MSRFCSLGECPVVILAGGLGTRLLSVVADRPKGLAPVGDRPFLEIQIALLRDQGARRFVLCVGHRASQIRDCLGDGSRLGVQIEYSIETETLMGTGGALRLAERYFEPHALVLNGDTYLAADYARILEYHIEERTDRGAVATMTLARLNETQRFGTVVLDPSERYVSSFREKVPEPNGPAWLNAGAYLIERKLIDRIPSGQPCSLERDVFPAALADGMRIAVHQCVQPFFDIGTAEDFQRFRHLHEEWTHEHAASRSSRSAG
jgi:NDP-sugar pyrophosphorylase family protein